MIGARVQVGPAAAAILSGFGVAADAHITLTDQTICGAYARVSVPMVAGFIEMTVPASDVTVCDPIDDHTAALGELAAASEHLAAMMAAVEAAQYAVAAARAKACNAHHRAVMAAEACEL